MYYMTELHLVWVKFATYKNMQIKLKQNKLEQVDIFC